MADYLPIELSRIKEISERCKTSSKEVVKKFEEVMKTMDRGVEYVGTGEPGSQALFFCQALFAYKLKRVW